MNRASRFRTIRTSYFAIRMPQHPRADSRGRVMEHIVVAEMALGKPLPIGAVVHHVNENHYDNRNENLVICENRAYHALLHARLRALKECGNPDWRRCNFCHKYDDPANLRRGNRTQIFHDGCVKAYHKRYRRGITVKQLAALARE